MYPACIGRRNGTRVLWRCTRDEISPRPQEGSQLPELSSHHAVEPAVDAPENHSGKDSCSVSPIGTQGRARSARTGRNSTRGIPCRPPGR
ncbi:hypothetical protein CP978_07860 [Streptomyces nodosus]|uniref:Uncharacterized protein n=1 Tax=Streptomyces nodosus TaxID=40318 RepID=A0A5P2VXW9_9ACTN|nr:hypothetical protein CP978_07860 [Streptomyces nodosus]